jgi:hypothetical protein
MKILRKIQKEDEGFSTMVFLSEEKFKKVFKLYLEFIKKVDEIEAEENGIKQEKPFYVFTLGIPLKKIIENMSTSS